MINVFHPRPSKVLFIDETYLKNVTEIDANVDPKMIRTTIMYIQDKFILPVIGNNIFENMKQLILSGTSLSGNPSAFLSTNYLLILEEYIQPILAAASMMELVYKMSIQFRNKGPQQAHGEFTTTPSMAQLDYLSESYRETASFYSQRLTQFLSANPDLFPEWLNPQLNSAGNGADLYYPENTNYFCGLHLPGMNISPATSGEYAGMGMSVLQRSQLLGYE